MTKPSIIVTHNRRYCDVRCICELNDTPCPNDDDKDTLCLVPMNYLKGKKPANYPVPAIYGIPNFDTYKCHGFWIAQMSDLTAPLERLPVP